MRFSLFILFSLCVQCAAALSLNEAVGYYALHTPTAKALRLRQANNDLEYENYRKSFLPSMSFGLSPLSLNRSLRLLQDPVSGSYSYVKDYSNSSSTEISISQKVGITGGSFSLSSSLGFLREFSSNRNSFNSSPLYFSYSQPLLGEAKLYRYNKAIQFLQHELSKKNFCTSMSSEQQRILSLYLDAYVSKLQYEVSLQNKQTGDTLLRLAQKKLVNGVITKYEYNQIELQQLKTAQDIVTNAHGYHDRMHELSVELGIANIELERPDGSVLPLKVDYEDVIPLVQMNNPQYLSVEVKRKQTEYSRLQTKNALRFNGNVSLSYGMNQYGESLQDVYRHPEQRQAVSVTFSFPVFQWGINHNKRQIAENEYEASMLEIEKSEQTFENSIKTQVDRYNTTYQNYYLSERTFTLSKEQYNLAVKKFSAGKVSVYEVTNAYSSLLSSTIDYASNLQGVYKEYYSLRHLALYDFIAQTNLEHIYLE